MFGLVSYGCLEFFGGLVANILGIDG
jgi:hypothetical protein